jgi:L-lactate dehydrogenase (cytochrome)
VASLTYNPAYPGIDDLRRRAQQRIPRFAFEYLDGGCNEDVNLERNVADLRAIQLEPVYLSGHVASDMGLELFGHRYDAPFGIAPVGLQGLIWPGATEILARASRAHNIPFLLSTVTTASIETVAEITGGRFWFQLYHPAQDAVRDDLLHRAWEAGCRVLVILADVPAFGYRPRELRNGLSLPPRMTGRNLLQMAARPRWALATLRQGRPQFATMKPYMDGRRGMKHLGAFMNETFAGRLDRDKIGAIRDRWKGTLVIKGIASAQDAGEALRLGADGLIVSNHGGRQLDAGPSAIASLRRLAPEYRGRCMLMMDSGLRSGPDIARALACGAAFTFLGRAFMYGVAALGEEGGNHTAMILKAQLQQVMEQLGCAQIEDLSRRLVEA